MTPQFRRNSASRKIRGNFFKLEEESKLVEYEENRAGYQITISGGGKNRVIRLSSFAYNFGVMSAIIGVFIFIGACGFSVYSALNFQQHVENLKEAQRVGEMQQEQILTISRKASTLSETLQSLAQQEEELRIQAGLTKPALEDTIPEYVPEENPEDAEITLYDSDEKILFDAGDFPEAPIDETPAEEPPTVVEAAQEELSGALQVDEVSEALTMLELRAEIRTNSLDDFQKELKVKREQMYAVATVPDMTPDMIVIDGGFGYAASSVTLDLSKFGGTPSANPNMPSIWPTNGVVTSPYGLRWGGTDFHPGIDIANDLGTPIIATADGVIDYAGWDSGGYGNMVDIVHGNGIMTRYAHASQVVVTAGQYVKRGQLIAYMGSTGFSTGPHVHYEVHVNGQRVNPISYL